MFQTFTKISSYLFENHTATSVWFSNELFLMSFNLVYYGFQLKFRFLLINQYFYTVLSLQVSSI